MISLSFRIAKTLSGTKTTVCQESCGTAIGDGPEVIIYREGGEYNNYLPILQVIFSKRKIIISRKRKMYILNLQFTIVYLILPVEVII